MKRAITAGLFATALGVVSVSPCHAQLFGGGIVFDPSNYAQNLATATRALQQINNQIRSLQNEAQMLRNMDFNLGSLDMSELNGMIAGLTQVSTLIDQARGIAFNVEATRAAFAQSYPGNYPAGTSGARLDADAQARWQQAMDAFRKTLTVQSQVAENVQSDAGTLSSLVGASQGAQGNLAVSQAGNQLLALSVKQQLQIQNLMAAQYRATALDEARKAEADAEGRAAFQRFIGSGQAYTGQ